MAAALTAEKSRRYVCQSLSSLYPSPNLKYTFGIGPLGAAGGAERAELVAQLLLLRLVHRRRRLVRRRTTASGDVCNKIGTYLKALAAHDNGVPFHVALPGPTIDWKVRDGVREIPIEARGAEEVGRVTGRLPDGTITEVEILPVGAGAANPAFDVTPARLITGLITERGLCPATEAGLLSLYPEMQDDG